MARVLPDFDREQARNKTGQVDRVRAVLAFRYRESSGAERSQVTFFFFSSAFLRLSLPPDRTI